MTDLHFEQLDQEGYTIIPDFLNQQTTRSIRRHIDTL